MIDTSIFPVTDRQRIIDMMVGLWGTSQMMVGSHLYEISTLDMHGLYTEDKQLLAFANWTQRGQAVVLCAMHALVPGQSYARRLLEGLLPIFRQTGASKVRAITTNDNMSALIFYQRFGFRLSTLYVGAIDAYRPWVPLARQLGEHGIPIHDVIELEMPL